MPLPRSFGLTPAMMCLIGIPSCPSGHSWAAIYRILGGRSLVLPFVVGAANAGRCRRWCKRKGGGPNPCERRFPHEVGISRDLREHVAAAWNKAAAAWDDVPRPTVHLMLGPVRGGQ